MRSREGEDICMYVLRSLGCEGLSLLCGGRTRLCLGCLVELMMLRDVWLVCTYCMCHTLLYTTHANAMYML